MSLLCPVSPASRRPRPRPACPIAVLFSIRSTLCARIAFRVLCRLLASIRRRASPFVQTGARARRCSGSKIAAASSGSRALASRQPSSLSQRQGEICQLRLLSASAFSFPCGSHFVCPSTLHDLRGPRTPCCRCPYSWPEFLADCPTASWLSVPRDFPGSRRGRRRQIKVDCSREPGSVREAARMGVLAGGRERHTRQRTLRTRQVFSYTSRGA
jgi:hypothetical protein